MKKNILFVTTSRAEFGLLRPIIEKLISSKQFTIELLVTGFHAASMENDSIKEVIDSKIEIKAIVPMDLRSDEWFDISCASAKLQMEMTGLFKAKKTDLLFVLGDRFELLPICTASFWAGIPIAHVHGGEITDGSEDDTIRHSISKLSSIHFTSAEAHRDRLIRMGEEPSRVFAVGAPGLDNVKNQVLHSRDETFEKLSVPIGCAYFVVTYHATTNFPAEDAVALDSLEELVKNFPQFYFIITGTNGDKGSLVIKDRLKKIEQSYEHVRAFATLGNQGYLSAVKYSSGSIGNSSSGLYEVPFMHRPSINIGSRQLSRLAPGSVINTSANYKDLKKAFETAIAMSAKGVADKDKFLFGTGQVASKILDILSLKRNFPVNNRKKYFDMDSKSGDLNV
jgi:GDP/UDP-N,N'-diacetylbacillosamine 2-epimerase (hydrolysing)